MYMGMHTDSKKKTRTHISFCGYVLMGRGGVFFFFSRASTPVSQTSASCVRSLHHRMGGGNGPVPQKIAVKTEVMLSKVQAIVTNKKHK